MNIKHLQLNTSTLRSPDGVVNFILENNIDVACLQEIVYSINGENPLKKFVEEKGYYYLEGINYKYIPGNQIVAEAVVSKWPFIDYHISFYNSPTFEPKVIKEEDMLGELIVDTAANNFSGSRGVKHAVKSRCIVNSLINTPEGILRVITAHYSVSDLCTETLQMLDMSRMISSLVRYSKELPTIFSGDLNIRSGSYSVAKLSEVMTCHTKDLKDTLSLAHESKKKDFPEGLAVDHVFSVNLIHQSTDPVEIDFSNHKAIISKFEMYPTTN